MSSKILIYNIYLNWLGINYFFSNEINWKRKISNSSKLIINTNEKLHSKSEHLFHKANTKSEIHVCRLIFTLIKRVHFQSSNEMSWHIKSKKKLSAFMIKSGTTFLKAIIKRVWVITYIQTPILFFYSITILKILLSE